MSNKFKIALRKKLLEAEDNLWAAAEKRNYIRPSYKKAKQELLSVIDDIESLYINEEWPANEAEKEVWYYLNTIYDAIEELADRIGDRNISRRKFQKLAYNTKPQNPDDKNNAIYDKNIKKEFPLVNGSSDFPVGR